MILLDGRQNWMCPNCDMTAVTTGQPNQFHECSGLRGLNAPMVLEGSDCKVEAVEREDYLSGDVQTTDGEGRPIMSIVTTYADGHNDVVVNAGVATATGDAF